MASQLRWDKRGKPEVNQSLEKLTNDELLELARWYGEFFWGGGMNRHAQEFGRVFRELDTRMMDSKPVPKSWHVPDRGSPNGVHDCCNCCDYYNYKD